MFRRYLLIGCLLAVTAFAYGNTLSESEQQPNNTEAVKEEDISAPDHIVISKERMCLELYDNNNQLICSFPVSLGKNYGDKQELGDMKTPEGDFSIVQIQRASHWVYNNGKESIKGYYGNWFIRLGSKHRGIGIHGTHNPEHIGERSTEGSIRLNNYHLDSLRTMVNVGMAVRIESSRLDLESDGKDIAEVEMPTIVVETAHPITDNSASPVIEQTPEEKTATEATTTTTTAKEVEKSTEVAKTPAKTAKVKEEWYTVKDGDLVGRIAADHGISISDIKRLNPDMNVDRISIGQKIKVKGEMAPIAEEEAKPAPAPVEAKPGEVWHTVEDGDLVGRIAEKYGTSTRSIKELNPDLNVDRISIGQRIRVK